MRTEMDSVLVWKQEPVSPLGYEEVAPLPDETFYQTALIDDIKFETEQHNDDEEMLCESKAEVASQILENLESLMDLDDLIKDGKKPQKSTMSTINCEIKNLAIITGKIYIQRS